MRNYLRVRGEYRQSRRERHHGRELPPRARRIRHNICFHVFLRGTTSACAENTAIGYASLPITVELPPRARRIPPNPSVPVFAKGTTSACAENTETGNHNLCRSRNYLRVRGEYPQV